MVSFSLFHTPLGECGIAWRDDLVVATRLPDRNPADSNHRLAASTGGTPGAPPAVIRRAIALIIALLDGNRTDLSSVGCSFDGIDPFAARVYAATRAITVGETSTYGAIASQLGGIQLARSVGQALGRNPLPIIVPCHRVIGAGGALTGFSAEGGVETKLRMLAIEGAQIGGSPGLFDDLPLAAKPAR